MFTQINWKSFAEIGKTSRKRESIMRIFGSKKHVLKKNMKAKAKRNYFCMLGTPKYEKTMDHVLKKPFNFRILKHKELGNKFKAEKNWMYK